MPLFAQLRDQIVGQKDDRLHTHFKPLESTLHLPGANLLTLGGDEVEWKEGMYGKNRHEISRRKREERGEKKTAEKRVMMRRIEVLFDLWINSFLCFQVHHLCHLVVPSDFYVRNHFYCVPLSPSK